MKKIYSLLIACVGFVSTTFSQTAFTPGNLVVLRIGDGSGALTSAATPVFLDEYSTITGQVVQSIALPTTVNGSNRRLTLSGSATSEGALSLSPNGQYLCLAGYDTTTGTASVASANVGKTVALLGANGVVNTSSGIQAGSGFNTSNVRGAVTNNGTGVWVSGAGSGGSGGTYFLPAGAFTSIPIKVSAAPTNTRTINIFNGQLYTSAASSTYYGISEVGAGLPTTSGQTTTILPGFPGATTGSSSYAFAFFDLNLSEAGLDVAYVADDNIADGIIKYSKVAGTWVKKGNITTTKALRGLTFVNACGKIRGFVTSEDSVYSFVDNAGYNQNLNGTLTKLIGRSNNNVVFRGIAFAPGTVASTAPTASATNVKDAKCFGAANGEATISVTGGTGTLTYSWSDNGTGATRTNLADGVYSVTVSDQLACTAVVSNITIDEPAALIASTIKTNVSCFGLTDGNLSPSATGGTPVYQYAWNTGNGTNLAAGIYTVTITDSEGCTVVKKDTITQPALLTISATKGNVTCGSTNNGFINTTTAGGNGGNTYQWENGTTTTANRTGLTAAAYAVTVTDSKGCTASRKDTINQSSNLSVAGLDTNVRCYGTATGAINITATGGSGVFTYNWGNNITSEDRTNLGVGTYNVTVSDNGGCTGSASFTLTQPDSLYTTAVVTNASCYGKQDGVINVTTFGGTLPYLFTWNTGDLTEDLDSLSGGVYTPTTTDGNGCTYTKSFTVTQPDSLALTSTSTAVSCYGGNSGSISLSVSGGTPQYTYTWTGGLTGTNPSTISAGTYTVTVSDSKNCTKAKVISVTQPDSLRVTGVVTNVTSVGATNGAINVTVAGGTPNYDYDWGNSVTTQNRSNIGAGVYIVTVTDDKGCTKVKSFTVSQPSSLDEVGEFIWVQNLGIENGNLLFAIKMERTADVSITVVSTNGQLIQKQTIQNVNNQVVALDVAAIASGVYIVRFDVAGESIAKRVAIVK